MAPSEGGTVIYSNGREVTLEANPHRVFAVVHPNGVVVESFVYDKRLGDLDEYSRLRLTIKNGAELKYDLTMSIGDASSLAAALSVAIRQAFSIGVPVSPIVASGAPKE